MARVGVPVEPPSLRSGFAWSFAGNVVNGASQWLILALIARFTSVELLGQYALALAVASPIAMLAHMNLRTVLATDVEGEHPLRAYLTARIWVALAGLGATAAIAFFWRPFWPVGITIVVLGAALAIESCQDLCYGLMQRNERLDLVAKSMVIRGILVALLVAAALLPFRTVVAAAGGVLV